jgi:hypothetical protein
LNPFHPDSTVVILLSHSFFHQLFGQWLGVGEEHEEVSTFVVIGTLKEMIVRGKSSFCLVGESMANPLVN